MEELQDSILKKIDWFQISTYAAILFGSVAVGMIVVNYLRMFLPVMGATTLVDEAAGALSGVGTALSAMKVISVQYIFNLHIELQPGEEVCVEIFREVDNYGKYALKRVGRYEATLGSDKYHSVLRNIVWTGMRWVEKVQVRLHDDFNCTPYKIDIPQKVLGNYQTLYVRKRNLTRGQPYKLKSPLRNCSYVFDTFQFLMPQNENGRHRDGGL